MGCDEVREGLAEHLLGALPEDEAQQVRQHLRGCSACRAEFAALGEGISTFARAAHQVDPPEALRERVLGVLEEEWGEWSEPRAVRRRARVALLARAAVAVVLAGSLAWAGFSTARTQHLQDQAGRYAAFLSALGGRDVRVGTIRGFGGRTIQGSVVMYDSDVGQSWVLVLVRAPDQTGEARVLLASATSTVEMHPLQFDRGEASSWLVSGANLRRFDQVRILDPSGHVVAAAHIAGDES